MCGIAGILNIKKGPIDKNIIDRMVKIQKHRGPDDEGTYFDDTIAMGHCRLSIIDLSQNAHQPMSNEDNTKWIVFNGEIYNYVELRKELEGYGHKFKSASDTEVILHAYEQWQEDALGHFNGMWAFVIWDSRTRDLFASRDRFGIKPFYYYQDGDVFIFASEIKALLLNKRIKKRENEQAIFDYLISGYGYMDLAEYTFFKDIFKLKPGHYIKISMPKSSFEYKKYWDFTHNVSMVKHDRASVLEQFYAIFENAVMLRLRSDVKVGISLSGGLDSSSVACIADRVHRGKGLYSFSSSFDDKEANEKIYIDDVVAKTGLNPFFVSPEPENISSDLNDILWHQEEPYSTLSILPQWYIMKQAHDKDVKVLLTGQAGDETLGGYHKYYFYLFADLLCSFKWKKLINEIGLYRELKGNTDDIWKQIISIILSFYYPRSLRGMFKKRQYPITLNKDFVGRCKNKVYTKRKFPGILNNDLYNAFKMSPLPSLLHVDDRSSMAHSVETRSPFLDYRMIEFLFSLSAEYKINEGQTKFLLRESVKGILPERVRTRKDKMGFPTPLGAWLKGPLKNMVSDIFNSKSFIGRPYFNHKGVMKEFLLNMEHNKPNDLTIWSWVNLELWMRRFIDKDVVNRGE